jgi:tRNA (adenine-N(1)-)-methyltransferase non-catalytic subunit
MSESTELPGLIAIPSASNTSNDTASTSILYSRHYIRDQDLILIKLPSGQLKSTKIIKDAAINLGKYGTFKAIDLIGKPFGETYEIKAGEIFLVKATLQEIGENVPPSAALPTLY